MKKILFSMFSALLILCMTGCEGAGKASEGSVIKNLPGTWKVTQAVDENGVASDYEGEVIFEFGKQEDPTDFSQHNSSSEWGFFSYTENGVQIVTRGTWNIEPDDEDKGVFFYCQKGNQFLTILGHEFYFITKIGATMKWEYNSNDVAGYILTRVQ